MRAIAKGKLGAAALVLSLMVACGGTASGGPARTPTSQGTPAPSATASPSPSRTPTAFILRATATAEPLTATPFVRSCLRETETFPGHFWLQRPIAPPGRDSVDGTYRYGGTRGGTLEAHHGVEFINSSGTPVWAAADGVVIFAGDDHQRLFGPYFNFYGNLVILEHDLPEMSEALFTLYAHLSEVLVEAGQAVEAGDEIARVGSSGWATGSHLHFEVRQGENDYAATRNPELWLAPHEDEQGQPRGALVGYILSAESRSYYVSSVAIERLGEPGEPPLSKSFVEAYADETVNGDDAWGENFALGDLPAGSYRLSFFADRLYQQTVEVLPGRVTLAAFCLTVN